MKVLKAVLPVAGLGTRMLPATKEMLPITAPHLMHFKTSNANYPTMY